MRVLVTDNYEEMSKRAAIIIAGQVIVKPESVLGLATGDTPLGMYEELIKLYREGNVDFSRVTTFNLDEYCGLDVENPQSYHYYMFQKFFNHINIDYGRIHIPDGRALDLEHECMEYEKKIEEAGGIDLQILGIGRNGHIGFNEPDIKFESGTHIVNLDEDTIMANSRFFSSIQDVPTRAVSMGIKTIMHARKVILLASGIEKAQAIFNTVAGKITPESPASILQLHPESILIIDRQAASLLRP